MPERAVKGELARPLSPSFLNITIQLGNGAGFSQSSNFKRPGMNRISVAFMQNLCQHIVSVREGIKKTTVL
ncbi:MAG: hypothetical protein PHU71_04855, partial [Candidatus Gracilibacteria bacterium]|nr:hypothetical protein [Candidatus Gracilibacteria bacterium]